MRRTMIVLLACMALACGDDSVLAPGEVLPVVSLVGATDGPTSLMTVTVSNFGRGHFSYGGCALLIWRQEGDAWAPTPEYGDRHCVASEHDFGILSAPFGIGIAFAADLRLPSAVQSKPPHLAITR